MEPNLFRYVWRHSKREQLVILAAILLSLPFYFASFDLPKRIINDALQGRAFAGEAKTVNFLNLSAPLPEFLGGPIPLFGGFQVNQVQLLFALSAMFLALVIVNGAIKYYINLSKGILGERLLRRMRFELFSQYLRFKPEDIRAVKPAEAASIIKDEVEPIGGFTGDAFIQPAYLGAQALTALVFIMVQSVWLGLVALAVVLLQAFVIPGLRREQLRLARLRQIESRKLAGRIGEVIETAPAIQGGGSGRFVRSDLAGRLGTLFKIRVDLFRRKFAVKYLNNLLAQVTPFFFYSIGGYLALKGHMNIGQLVAVIGAYRDLPPPIKELIDWDQNRADVTIKYQQIIAQFPAQLMADDGDEAPAEPPPATAPIVISSLKVIDRRGVTLLEPLTVTIDRPAHVALLGNSGSGRDVLARVLGRQISEFKGSVAAAGVRWSSLTHATASRFISYVGHDPLLFAGSLRDNLIAPIMRQPPKVFATTTDDRQEAIRRMEAIRSGNPVALASGEWLDPRAAGLDDGSDIDAAVMALLAEMDMADDVYRFGLLGRLDPDAEAEAVASVPLARERIFAKLAERSLLNAVEPLDPEKFNRNSTLRENLLFGAPLGARFAEESLFSDPYVRSILEAESLIYPLAEIGLRMAEEVIEIFADLPPGHPLLQRLSYIRADEMPDYTRLVEAVRARGGLRLLSQEGQSRLVELAMSYIEPRHRMDVVTPTFEKRVLRARRSLKQYLPQAYAADIEFYDRSRYLFAASIRDNLLFGRITYGIANAEARVYNVIKDTLRETGLDQVIHRLGLAYDVGPGGKFLSNQQRAGVALARGLISRPDILIVDGALSAFGASDSAHMLSSLRKAMAGRTLIVGISQPEEAAGFDQTLHFEGPQLAPHIDAEPASTSIAEANSDRLVTASGAG